MHRMRLGMAGTLGLISVAMISGCSTRAPSDMVEIPSGYFIMGTDDVGLESEAEDAGITKPWVLDAAPARRVFLPTFYIDRHEVTNEDYFRFVKANGFPLLPDWRSGHPDPAQNRIPVTFVDWYEANAFCHWLGKRLPTETEWEKSARGPAGWIYPWGNFFDHRRANIAGLHPGPMPVGSFPLGRSPYGASDMIGNVWEWTADWYGPYPGTSYTTADFGKSYRVARGNSFAGLGHFSQSVMEEVEAVEARVSYRLYFPPNIALEDLGFRCAKDESGKGEPER
jgi:formylglycine-generating enzyme required for sulfatase activity